MRTTADICRLLGLATSTPDGSTYVTSRPHQQAQRAELAALGIYPVEYSLGDDSFANYCLPPGTDLPAHFAGHFITSHRSCVSPETTRALAKLLLGIVRRQAAKNA